MSDAFQQRKNLENKLVEVNITIQSTLRPIICDIIGTYEEYDDDTSDLAYGMPREKIIAKIQQRNQHYTFTDVFEVLDILTKEGTIIRRSYKCLSTTYQLPGGRVTCKNPENAQKMREDASLITKILYD